MGRSAGQQHADLVPDFLHELVDGAGDVRRGRHGDEHDRRDDAREGGGVALAEAVVATQHVGDGVFGLQGQREGVDAAGGEFVVASVPRATVTVPAAA